MFNSSLIMNNSAVFICDNLSWFCMCKEYSGTIVVVFTGIMCFIVGMPIHSWSLWVFLHRNFKPKMVFPLNMTVLEMVFCIQGFADFMDFKQSTEVSFYIAIFLSGLTWTFRPLIQIFTCIEQYLAVIHPVTFLRYKDIKYRILLVTVAWLTALGNGLRLAHSRLNYFRDHLYFVFFCLAVTTTSFCCASVLHALKRPGPGDRNNVEMTEKDRPNKTDRGRAVENQQKRRAFTIISHILVSILVCYFPLVVAYFMWITGVRAKFLCNVIPPILLITKSTLLISPLVRMYSEGHLEHMMCFSKPRGQIK